MTSVTPAGPPPAATPSALVVTDMLLSQENVFALAKNGNVQFDVLWSQLHGGGDWVTYAAEGVADFDRLIGIMVTGTEMSARFLIQEVQIGNQVKGEQRFDVEDVVAIRNQFIAFYGTVNKIPNPIPRIPTSFETTVNP